MKEFHLSKGFLLRAKLFPVLCLVAIIIGLPQLIAGPITVKIMALIAFPGALIFMMSSKYLKDVFIAVDESKLSYKIMGNLLGKNKFKEGSFAWDEIKTILFERVHGGRITVILKEQNTNPIHYFPTAGYENDIYNAVYDCANGKVGLEIDEKLNKKLKLPTINK